MKKAVNSKLLTSKNFLRKVFRRSPMEGEIVLQMSPEDISPLVKEVDALKAQIENLKAAVNALQEDADKKDAALTELTQEKEKLVSALRKQKRANKNLLQQLHDERKFYYKEKEIYCKEMNEYKKLRRNLSSSNLSEEDRKSMADYKKEITKLKQTLSETLVTNYNLSIKFLRMKNTKSYLKTELHKMHEEHEKVKCDLTRKIEVLTNEIRDYMNLKLDTTITPSNKKYLQLVKENSSLVYENLCLQLEVEKLNLHIDKIKLYKTKSETNSRLKYLRSRYSPSHTSEGTTKSKLKKVRIEEPEKLKSGDHSSEVTQNPSQEQVIKIFERLENLSTPRIEILPASEATSAISASQSNVSSIGTSVSQKRIRRGVSKTTSAPSTSVSTKTENTNREVKHLRENGACAEKHNVENNEKHKVRRKHKKSHSEHSKKSTKGSDVSEKSSRQNSCRKSTRRRERRDSSKDSKFALFQVSDLQSQTSSEFTVCNSVVTSAGVLHTQSAPELLKGRSVPEDPSVEGQHVSRINDS